MSEKRFKVDYEVGVLDTLTNEIICDTVNAKEVVDLLNEQQDTISQLEQENADCLGDKIQSLDEFEKCTNKLKERIIEQQATISQLKEENEQLNKKLKWKREEIKALIEESERDE